MRDGGCAACAWRKERAPRQAQHLANLKRRAARLAVHQRTAILAAADAQAGVPVIVGGTAGFPLMLARAPHAIEVSQYFLDRISMHPRFPSARPRCCERGCKCRYGGESPAPSASARATGGRPRLALHADEPAAREQARDVRPASGHGVGAERSGAVRGAGVGDRHQAAAGAQPEHDRVLHRPLGVAPLPPRGEDFRLRAGSWHVPNMSSTKSPPGPRRHRRRWIAQLRVRVLPTRLPAAGLVGARREGIALAPGPAVADAAVERSEALALAAG